MYLDLEDYRPDTPRVPSVISIREGVLLSLVLHAADAVFHSVWADRVVRGGCRLTGSRAGQQGTDEVRADAAGDRPGATRRTPGGAFGHRPAERDSGARSECHRTKRRSRAATRQRRSIGGPTEPPEPAASPPAAAPPNRVSREQLRALHRSRGRRRPAPPSPPCAERRARAPEPPAVPAGQQLRQRAWRRDRSERGHPVRLEGRRFRALAPALRGSGPAQLAHPAGRRARAGPRGRSSSRCCGTDRSSTCACRSQPAIDALTVSALNSIKLSNPTAVLPPDFPDDHAPFIVTFRYNEPVRESP